MEQLPADCLQNVLLLRLCLLFIYILVETGNLTIPQDPQRHDGVVGGRICRGNLNACDL